MAGLSLYVRVAADGCGKEVSPQVGKFTVRLELGSRLDLVPEDSLGFSLETTVKRLVVKMIS